MTRLQQIHNALAQIVNTHTHDHLMALCPGLPWWAGTRRNIHPLTPILIIRHPLSTSSIYYDLSNSWFNLLLNSPFPQPLSRFSLVCLLVRNLCFILHTFLLLITHAHTITTCFAVVPRLRHLFLISLSAHYLEICLLP